MEKLEGALGHEGEALTQGRFFDNEWRIKLQFRSKAQKRTKKRQNRHNSVTNAQSGAGTNRQRRGNKSLRSFLFSLRPHKKPAPDDAQTRVHDEDERGVKTYFFLVAASVTFSAAFFLAESVAFFFAPETVVLGLVASGFVASGKPALA